MPRVIVEGNTLSDDEEDRIVQAAVLDQAAADLTRSGFDELIGSDQGKLVEEILSAQRELDPFTDTVFLHLERNLNHSHSLCQWYPSAGSWDQGQL